MKTVADTGAIKAITTHYIDGAFVESHGQEVMDIIRPTDAKVIARVTLGDQEDTRRAIGRPGAPLTRSAGRRRKSAPAPYAACTRPSPRASMISPPRWWRSTEAWCSSPGPSWRRA